MKHLLFGINQSPNKKVENSILEGYKKLKKAEFTFDSEYYLAGIEKALGEKHYDVLILREDLEINKQVSKQLLDRITDKYSNLNIILIVKDEHESDRYIIDMFQLGIYNIIYKEDLTIPIVVNLIDNVRTKLDAKIYLDLEDAKENEKDENEEDSMLEIPEEQLITIIGNLNQATTENIFSLFDEICKQYEDKQVLFLVSILSDNISSALRNANNSTFIKYSNKLNKVVEKAETKDIEREKSNTKERFKEKTKIQKVYIEKEKIVEVEKKVVEKVYIEKEKEVKIFERPNDYKKKAGFVGFNGSGKTTLVCLTANYLGNNKVKTAIVDLTQTRDLYDIYVVNTIENNESSKGSVDIEGKNSLMSLLGGVIRPFKVNKYVDLYTAEHNSSVEIENPYYYIQLLEQEYDVILVDMDYKSPREVYQLINNAYIVQTLDLAKVKHNTSHQLDLKAHINMKKIRYIINQSMQCGITPKIMTSCLKTHTNLNTFEKVEITQEEVPSFTVSYSNTLRKMGYELDYNCNKLDKETLESIKVLVEDIYPLNTEGSKGIASSLRKLGSLFNKKKDRVIKEEEYESLKKGDKNQKTNIQVSSSINGKEEVKEDGNKTLKQENEIKEVELDDLYMED